jgi:hypothetical protein
VHGAVEGPAFVFAVVDAFAFAFALAFVET